MWLMICTTFRIVQAHTWRWPLPEASSSSCSTLASSTGLGIGELEMAPEVADGLALHVLDEGAVARARSSLSSWFSMNARGLGLVEQVEPVPVDDRAAAQNQPQRFDIVKREILEPFEPWGRGKAEMRSRERGGSLSGAVSVASWWRR